MATDAVPSTTPATTPAAAFQPAWGIAWGGGMLVVMSLWLRAKFDELSFLIVAAVGLLGVAGILFAGVQIYAARRRAASAETSARSAAGLVCLAGGALMIVLALILAITLGYAGFGEYVGLTLFGLVALTCGQLLRRKTPTDEVQVWNRIRARLDLVRFALWILGPACLIAFLTLGLYYKIGLNWFPELFGLLAAGGLFLTAAFWLQLQTAAGEFSPLRLRVFILVLGGLTGLIITLMILMRMVAWREQVFLGGIEVWRGEGIWRLWLCAYVLLIGLVLMFGSLLLARADIHQSAVLRRSLYGYNTIFNGVLLLAILVLANILFYIIYPYTFNWSRTAFSSLAPATKNLLASLQQHTTFYVLMSDERSVDLRPVLDNMRVENPGKITVRYISPDSDREEYFKLAEQFKEIEPERSPFGLRAKRGVLVVYGEMQSDPKKQLPPHAFVPDDKIFETKGDDPHMQQMGKGKSKTTLVFKAEPELMKELYQLSTGKEKRKLYVLQDNGEASVNNQEIALRKSNEPLSRYGIGKLVEHLKKEQFAVEGLRFTPRLKKEENVVAAPEVGPDKKKEIPDDAYALLIPGPSEPMSKETLDALERYLDKGGRLVAFMELVFDAKYTALQSSGLEDFLKKYGVEVRPEMMITWAPQLRLDPRAALTFPPRRPASSLAKQLPAGDPQVFITARPVKPLSSPGRFKAETLLELDAERLDFWTESSAEPVSSINAYIKYVATNPALFGRNGSRILQESMPLAVTVTEGFAELAKPRMVVFGDCDFILNTDRGGELGQELVTNALEWMTDKGVTFVGAKARETPTYNPPTKVEDPNTRLVLYPGLLMMFVVVGLGAGLWLVRRR